MRGVRKGGQRTGCIYTEYHNRGKNRGGMCENRSGWHRVRGAGMEQRPTEREDGAETAPWKGTEQNREMNIKANEK